MSSRSENQSDSYYGLCLSYFHLHSREIGSRRFRVLKSLFADNNIILDIVAGNSAGTNPAEGTITASTFSPFCSTINWIWRLKIFLKRRSRSIQPRMRRPQRRTLSRNTGRSQSTGNYRIGGPDLALDTECWQALARFREGQTITGRRWLLSCSWLTDRDRYSTNGCEKNIPGCMAWLV